MKIVSKILKYINRYSSKLEVIYTNKLDIYKDYDIGDYTYGKPVIMFKQADLKIGKFCSIAENVVIFLGGNHRIDWITTYPFNSLYKYFKGVGRHPGNPTTKGDVIIGNDVWIGYKACIMSGCRIGDGAVIAANSIITKDIPPYAIAAGNPAKVVKYRFNTKDIESLNRIAWWNWSIEKIREAWPLLMNPDIDKFISVYSLDN